MKAHKFEPCYAPNHELSLGCASELLKKFKIGVAFIVENCYNNQDTKRQKIWS